MQYENLQAKLRKLELERQKLEQQKINEQRKHNVELKKVFIKRQDGTRKVISARLKSKQDHKLKLVKAEAEKAKKEADNLLAFAKYLDESKRKNDEFELEKSAGGC